MKNLFARQGFAVTALIILAVVGTALYRSQARPDLVHLLGGPEQVETTAGPVPLDRLFDEVTVVFFGFTQCPDICPTTLSVVSRAYKKLPEDQQKRLRVLFVTLDPERDTLKTLTPYVGFFGDRIMGVRLDPEALERWVRTFGVFYEKVPLPDSEMGYTINHTAAFFIIRAAQWPGQIMMSHDVEAVAGELAAAFQ
ncbi:SCO family protein [Hahella sp. SMD15-11]|uniref:SCO family protein n=1 Tax=Thermohahella caldifontis TaxID=3142973 RepID=A0AB39UXL2_9GAMM